jgi:hypothetical protein
MERRWRSLQELRDAYAASGLELAKKHPACRGKVRHGTEADADRHVAQLVDRRDEHASRAARIGKYFCRWCGGYHVGHAQPATTRRRAHGRRIQH